MSEEQIKVTVKFFANLRAYAPAKSIDTYAKNSYVNDIIEKYNIPKKEQKNLIILINGIPQHNKNLKSELHDGDLVSIFPPIGGG